MGEGVVDYLGHLSLLRVDRRPKFTDHGETEAAGRRGCCDPGHRTPGSGDHADQQQRHRERDEPAPCRLYCGCDVVLHLMAHGIFDRGTCDELGDAVSMSVVLLFTTWQRNNAQ